jgi:hypothetical protein
MLYKYVVVLLYHLSNWLFGSLQFWKFWELPLLLLFTHIKRFVTTILLCTWYIPWCMLWIPLDPFAHQHTFVSPKIPLNPSLLSCHWRWPYTSCSFLIFFPRRSHNNGACSLSHRTWSCSSPASAQLPRLCCRHVSSACVVPYPRNRLACACACHP